MKKHVLFVCGAGINRSKLAEELYKSDVRYEVRSAGIRQLKPSDQKLFPYAKKLREEDLSWADQIFTFADPHDLIKEYLSVDTTKIVDVFITDHYSISNPKKRERLQALLIEKLRPYLGEPQTS